MFGVGVSGAAGVFGLIFLVIIFDGVLFVAWALYRCFSKQRLNTTRGIGLLIKIVIIMWAIIQFLFIIVFAIALTIGTMSHNKAQSLEAEKDKNRYFTLTEDTPYGDIIMPKGTHVWKEIPYGTNPNQPANLTELYKARFPHPIDINGLSVIAIQPQDIITFELTQTASYAYGKRREEITADDTLQQCTKNDKAIIGPDYKDRIVIDHHKPYLPEYFRPIRQNWYLKGCRKGKYVEPIHVPYWKDGVLIRPAE